MKTISSVVGNKIISFETHTAAEQNCAVILSN